MTQEEKQLLLQDLCGRLPYGVKVELHEDICTLLGYSDEFVMLTANVPTGQQTNISNIKLFLRPMSSMTDEEDKDFALIQTNFYVDGFLYPFAATNMVDWLNSHHFDYRGLIEKGLAIESPKGMYEEE